MVHLVQAGADEMTECVVEGGDGEREEEEEEEEVVVVEVQKIVCEKNNALRRCPSRTL